MQLKRQFEWGGGSSTPETSSVTTEEIDSTLETRQIPGLAVAPNNYPQIRQKVGADNGVSSTAERAPDTADQTVEFAEKLVETSTNMKLRLRISAVIFYIAFCVSAGAFYVLNSLGKSTETSPIAIASVETTDVANFHISAADPAGVTNSATPPTPIAETAPIEAESGTATLADAPAPQSLPVSYNVSEQARQTEVNISNRSFAYVSTPRGLENAPYISVEIERTNKKSLAGELGLTPSPEGSGRLTSNGGIDWQGSWELNNPAGNTQRGTSYLNYLQNTFKSNLKDSLVTREVGKGKIGSHLAGETGKTAPLVRYTK